MKKLLLLLSFISVFTFSSCTEDDSNEIGITSYMFLESETSRPTFENEVSTTEIVIASTTKSSVDRLVSVVVDAANSTATASQYTLVTSQVVIPAGSYVSSTTIKVAGVYNELPALGEETLVLKLEEGVNVVSSNATNTISLFRACASNPVTLSFAFDGYGSEIGWTLVRQPNTTVGSAATGSYTDGQASFSQDFCLEAGTYVFTVTDSFGDGLSFPGNGSYNITHLDGTVLVSGGGDFGSVVSHTFTVN